MNSNADFERIAQAWLQDGPTEMPDRSIQAALDEIHATSQRRFGAARRLIPMNGNTSRFAIAAVIGLLVVAAGGIYLGSIRSDQVGEPPVLNATPSPTPSPSPAPTLAPLSRLGSIEAGTQLIDGGFPVSGVTFTLGPGWRLETLGASKVELSKPIGSSTPTWLTFVIVNEVYPDPCGAPMVPTSTPLGQTVDDLVVALTNLKGYESGPITNINLGGLPAKSFELDDAADSTCETNVLIGLANDIGVNRPSHQRMVVLDVNGQRLLVDALSLPDAGGTQADRDEMDRIIESIGFDG